MPDRYESAILNSMTPRLQVFLDEAELAEIRRIASQHRMTVSEWVRQALRMARVEAPVEHANRKLMIVGEAYRSDYPTADIDQMLEETELGRLGEHDS